MEDKNYIYPDGKKVIPGDICYYTEKPQSNYADSIGEIFVKASGLMAFRHHVYNRSHDYALITEVDPCELKYSTGFDGITLVGFTKLGDLSNYDELCTIEYAEKNYPLLLDEY